MENTQKVSKKIKTKTDSFLIRNVIENTLILNVNGFSSPLEIKDTKQFENAIGKKVTVQYSEFKDGILIGGKVVN